MLTNALSLIFLISQAASQPTVDSKKLDQLITLDVKGETVKVVLTQIESQADVRFLYSNELIGANRKIDLEAVNQPLSHVLTLLLTPLHIKYELVEDGIVLTPAPATGSLSGRVTNSNGEPMPGATVRIEKTELGAATDVDGHFAIANVPDGPHILVVSSIGYVTIRQEFTMGDGPQEFNFNLQENEAELNEVVVVGYGTSLKKDVTGAVTTVSSKDFVQGQVTDPQRLIQGKMAGVQIAASGGAPGEVGVIRIRGGASLNASNDPLIVIDGVPVDNFGIAGAGSPLALINPNDIETFTVLKDASATAIYGSRASNGVILITTKKGIAGDKMHVMLNTSVSRSTNYGKVDVLTGDQYRALTDQGIAAGLVKPSRRDLLGTANTDWQKEIYQPAYTTDNSVSVTGSLKNLPFRASVGHLEQQGTLKTGYMKRNTASIGLTPRLLDNHLKIDINVKGTETDFRFADQGAIGGAVRFDPTHPVKSGDTAYNGYFEWLEGNGHPNQLTDRNPVALLNDKRDVSRVWRSIGNAQFDYSLHFLPDLHTNLNLGYDVTRSHGTVDVPANSSVAYNIFGQKNQYRQERNNKLLEFYLNYTKTLGDHHIEVLAGYSYQDFLRYSPFYFGLTAAGTRLDTNATASPPYKTQNTLVSFYGRANYSYKDKYLLTATLRDDGSSHFAKGNKWGLFPAASVAWRVTQEDFLVNSSTVSDLKLRASYGITGQQDIYNAAGTDYPFLARYQPGASSVQARFGDAYVSTLRAASYDPNLKWEQTATYNAGLDFGLFQNRVSGSLDVYQRYTKDLLVVIPVAAGTNLRDNVLTNIGSMESHGIELNLNYAILQSREGLNWSVNFNATVNRNEITKLTNVRDPSYIGAMVNPYQINSVGYAANSFYVLKQRYDDNDMPINDTLNPTNAYVDMNGDGQINERDYYRYKSPAPRAIFGFSSNLGYKGFSLAFTIRSNVNNYVFNNAEADRTAYTSLFPAQPFVLNGNPAIYNTQFYYPQLHSDYYIRNASFIRLENVTLGYNLGRHIKSIPTLRLSLAAQNLLVMTRYTGVNPEVFFGVDNNLYPLPRTFTLGLSAGF